MQAQLNNKATAIFHALVKNVNGSGYAKIDNSNGSFMPLSIDLLQSGVDFAGETANIYALAHYFEQNGDLVPDPDMTFAALKNGRVLPLTIQTQFGYREAIFIKNGNWVMRKSELKDQINFANMWLNNIKEQQGIKINRPAPASSDLKKITLTTIKTFIKNNAGNLYEMVYSSFDGMTDGIEYTENPIFHKVEKIDFSDRNFGLKKGWFVFDSRDYFQRFDENNFYGFKISNCCGSFVIAAKQETHAPAPVKEVINTFVDEIDTLINDLMNEITFKMPVTC